MKKFDQVFRAYLVFVIRYRLLVFIGILCVSAFLGAAMGSLKMDMDPDIWAPQQHPYVQATKVVTRTFGGENVTVIGIVPRRGDIYQSAILEKVRRIQAGIEAIPQAIRHNTYSIAARQVKDIKGVPDGMEVKPLLPRHPKDDLYIERVKAAVAANPTYIDTLVSRDKTTAAVITDFKIDKTRPSYSTIYRQIRKVTDAEEDDTVDIYLGGGPIATAWFEHHMLKMPVFFGAALLVIVVVQYWSFRSAQGVLLPILTALLSVVWALGLMGLFGVHMDPMNTTTPILVMAIAAGHAVQILKRYYEEYYHTDGFGVDGRAQSRTAVLESLAKVGPIMLVAGIIAALTFFSLSTSDISVVSHFGVFAGSGVISVIILELTLIPAIRSWLPPPSDTKEDKKPAPGIVDRGLSGLSSLMTNGRASWILGLSLLALLLTGAGMKYVTTDNSLKRYNSEGSEVRRDDMVLNARLAGTSSLSFLIEGKTDDSIKRPDVLRAMDELQQFLEAQPYVGKTQSIADFIKRMNQAMHNEEPEYYAIPGDFGLVAQYLFLYATSGDPGDFDRFVDNNYKSAVVLAYLKDDSTAFAEELGRKAEDYIHERFPPDIRVRLSGSLPQTAAVNDVLTREKFENIAQMIVIVFLLASIALRSPIGGLFASAPLVVIIIANFGIMGWMNIPVDMGTSATASMAIGIGADYELYLLFRFREELARLGSVSEATRVSLLSAGKAILVVAMSIAGGYAVLLASDFAFYQRLGLLVVTTMTISALSALIFLRSMVSVMKPDFIFNRMPFAKPVGQ